MEAAVCGAKSIALSYAFFDRNHDAQIIADASALSARLIQHLWDNWDANTQLYSVNVPLVEGVKERKILWTNMLQNWWKSGSCFQVVDTPTSTGDDDPESTIRKQEEKLGRKELRSLGGEASAPSSGVATPQPHMRYTHKEFKWAPLFKDVYESVEASEPGNDGWAVAQGYTSVTPLRANFMHVDGFKGEITLGEEKKEPAALSAEDAERQSDDR